MAVSVISYLENSCLQWAAVDGEKATPLGAFPSLNQFLLNTSIAEIKQTLQTTDASLKLDELDIQSPVTEPCRIICQGTNYLDHLEETGAKAEDQPYNLLFAKDASTLAPAVGNLHRPANVQLLDYELELGLVIKKDIKQPTTITNANLPDFIAGIVIANDVSARGIQISQEQWFKGKSFRGFCPAGPYLCLLEDEDFDKLDNLELELKVNGETRQKVNTSLMIFKPAETLTEISTIFNLARGDLLLTGTPGGVALQPPSALKIKLATLFLSPHKRSQKFIQGQLKVSNYLQKGDMIEARITDVENSLNLGTQKLLCK